MSSKKIKNKYFLKIITEVCQNFLFTGTRSLDNPLGKTELKSTNWRLKNMKIHPRKEAALSFTGRDHPSLSYHHVSWPKLPTSRRHLCHGHGSFLYLFHGLLTLRQQFILAHYSLSGCQLILILTKGAGSKPVCEQYRRLQLQQE